MKKPRLAHILIAGGSLLVVGVSVFSAIAINNSFKTKNAVASTTDSTTGIYKNITDPSTLSYDDTILLVDSDGNTFKEVVDGYNHGGTKAISKEHVLDHGGFGEDDDSNQCLAIYNSYAEELTLKAGNTAGSFAFKGTSAFTDYIAFLGGNGLGSQGGISNATSWRFQVSDVDSSYFKIYNSGNDIYLAFEHGSGNYGMSSEAYNAPQFRIYKKMDTITQINMTNSPTQMTYYVGDKVNLSGLSVDISFGSAMSGHYVTLKYNDAKGAFSYNPTITYAHQGQGYFPVLVLGARYVNIEFNMLDRPEVTYTKVTSPLVDYRGTYLLVYQDNGNPSNSAVFNSRLDAEKIDKEGNFSRDITITNNQITSTSYAASLMTMRVVRETVDGASKYFLKTPENQYLTFPWRYSSLSGQYGMSLADTVIKDEEHDIYSPDDTGTPIEFFQEKGTIVMNYDNHWTDLSLRFSDNGDDSYFEFTESFDDNYNKDVCLYKLDYNSSISSEISTFKSAFFNTTSVCDATGVTNNITSQAWADLSDSFNALTEDAKGYIASITYTHEAETPGSEGAMADRYDYIISKYNSLGDFMNRKDTTSYQNNYNPQSANKLVFFNDTNNYVVVIIVMASIVSISGLGLFFLSKKYRKH